MTIIISEFDRRLHKTVYHPCNQARFSPSLHVGDEIVEPKPGDQALVSIGLNSSAYPDELALLQERGLSFAGKGPGNTYVVRPLRGLE